MCVWNGQGHNRATSLVTRTVRELFVVLCLNLNGTKKYLFRDVSFTRIHFFVLRRPSDMVDVEEDIDSESYKSNQYRRHYGSFR